MSGLFDMGAHGIYVWSAYLATGGAALALLVWSFVQDFRQLGEYKRLLERIRGGSGGEKDEK